MLACLELTPARRRPEGAYVYVGDEVEVLMFELLASPRRESGA
jgi:hypothetical protein